MGEIKSGICPEKGPFGWNGLSGEPDEIFQLCRSHLETLHFDQLLQPAKEILLENWCSIFL